MKKVCFIFAALLAVACTDNVVTVIPEPVSMTVGSGSFALSESVQINCKDSSLVRTAEKIYYPQYVIHMALDAKGQ